MDEAFYTLTDEDVEIYFHKRGNKLSVTAHADEFTDTDISMPQDFACAKAMLEREHETLLATAAELKRFIDCLTTVTECEIEEYESEDEDS